MKWSMDIFVKGIYLKMYTFALRSIKSSMYNAETLESIEQLVERNNDIFYQYRTLLIENQVSNYPIFILNRNDTNILGRKIIDQQSLSSEWNVYLSHLEELYHKGIVTEDKLDNFRLQYKDKSDMFCILYIANTEEYGFLFVPILY